MLLVGGGVAGTWLLPSMAVPESRVASGAPGAALRATAHVTFKVIIPKVLYVRVGTASENALDPGNVAVMSNGHNATLNAALRTPDSNVPARGNLILNSAARKGIAQNAQCALSGRTSLSDRASLSDRVSLSDWASLSDTDSLPAAAPSGDGNSPAPQLVCTVSTP